MFRKSLELLYILLKHSRGKGFKNGKKCTNLQILHNSEQNVARIVMRYILCNEEIDDLFQINGNLEENSLIKTIKI